MQVTPRYHAKGVLPAVSPDSPEEEEHLEHESSEDSNGATYADGLF